MSNRTEFNKAAKKLKKKRKKKEKKRMRDAGKQDAGLADEQGQKDESA